MLKSIKGYIYNSVSYEKSIMISTPRFNGKGEDKEYKKYNFVDLFFIDLTKEITNENYIDKYYCLRIYNFNLSFFLCRLPGQSFNEFKAFCDKFNTNKIVKFKYHDGKKEETLTDSMYFSFGNATQYLEVETINSSDLQATYKKLKEAVKKYYETLREKIKLNKDYLTGWDKVFYDNTETPFRFDMTSLLAKNGKYYLSTKYNIPCVGGFELKYKGKEIEFDYELNEDKQPGLKLNDRYLAKTGKKSLISRHIIYFNCQGDNNRLRNIKHDDEINGQDHITLLSYDIETYDSNMEITEDEKYIMCIGVGLFNITDDKPFKRWCISSKDITPEDEKKLNIISKEEKNNKIYYTVKNEYSTTDQMDISTYIIVPSEYDILRTFISLIGKYKPVFITGFNNYGFDDRRIFGRMKYNDEQNTKTKNYIGLVNLMLSTLCYYNLSDDDLKYYRNYKDSYKPEFKSFTIKLDGEMYNDNQSFIEETSSIFTDTYKIMLASNPKLYTQQGRGNLDTMLEVNNIKNPFNGKSLSKSGLSYNQMWYNWNNNVDIYDILLYCCQDAWITGTLLIKSCQLIDKIEMSTLSCTTISDSIFKAVTWRVKHLTEKYAWDYNFAVADTVPTKTKDGEHISRADNHDLGNKYFDVRQIVGGEVKSIAPGRQKYIIALDFSAMYPSQKEGSNIDTSTLIDKHIIDNPELYGLRKYHEDIIINDMYKRRYIYYFENVKDNKKYIIETFHSEFKNKKDEIKKVIENLIIDARNKRKAKADNEEAEEIKAEEIKAEEIEDGERKSDKDILIEELRKLYPTYYKKIISDIYDSKCYNIDLLMRDIKDTELKDLYIVQSPRNENNLVSTHYSLKEIMLSDLRTLRSKVKKQMENATNPLDKNRYNSKQLAIKIMCNSEYGASNSSYFPYYDTLIGGATTAASRCLINFLTCLLEANKLYVTERFLKVNEKYINQLAQYKIISCEKLQMKHEEMNKFIKENRRTSLREIYDEFYNIITDDIYCLTVEPSKVVYQDTDSNYYTNDYIRTILTPEDKHMENSIKQYYNQYDQIHMSRDELLSETPAIINMKMNLLLAHNNLYGNFIKDSILRKPISVGFEGAFIIARYFNVKKKYYGIVWNDGMESKLSNECYNINPNLPSESINKLVLKSNYGDIDWKPFKTTYPLPNGDYIKVDLDKLLHSNIDKLKYVKSQNVKCTGVDLARRDQYKFINVNHIRLIQKDLHYLQYEGNNKWKDVSDIELLTVVKNLLMEFNDQLIYINKLVSSMLNNEEFNYDTSELYSLRDYAKDINFKYNRCNKLHCLDPGFEDNYYIINDKPNGGDKEQKTNPEVIIKETGEKLILNINSEGYYYNIYSSKNERRSSKIPREIYNEFTLNKLDKDGKITSTKQRYEIIYDTIHYEKKSKLIQVIGDRLYKNKIEVLKRKLNRRLTDQEFNENFPPSFSRKQYVIINTEDVKKDRARGTKTENIKLADKAFLIKELHKQYREELPEEEYNKLLYHDKIPYKEFIDLEIINNLDYIHYIEAFCSAVSLYLIEFTKEITKDKKFDNLGKEVLDDVDENIPTIKDAKDAITWELLIYVRPERNTKLNRAKRIKKNTTDNSNQKLTIAKEEVRTALNSDEITTEYIQEYNLTHEIKLIAVDKEKLNSISSKLSKCVSTLAEYLDRKDKDIIDNLYYIITRYNYLERQLYIGIGDDERKIRNMENVAYLTNKERRIDNLTRNYLPDESLYYFDKYFKVRNNKTIEAFNKRLNILKEKLANKQEMLKLLTKIKKTKGFNEVLL